jgi:signal transduction histidine kinase
MSKVFGWLKQFVPGKTLASQILLYFLLAAFIASVTVGSFAYFTVRHRIRDQLADRYSEEASLVTTYIEQTLATGYYDVQLLSYNPVITSPTASLEEKEQEMGKSQSLHGLFEDITLLNPEGEILKSTSYSHQGDWKGDLVFKEALAGHPNMSDAQTTLDPGHVVIIMAAPVFDPNPSQHSNVTSVLTAQMSMEQIWQLTDSMKIGHTGYITIVNSFRRYIAHPDKEMLFKEMASKPVSDKEGNLLSYREAKGEDKRTGLLGQTISNPSWLDKGWQVMISQDSNEAFAYFHHAVWLIFLVLLLAVAFFLVVGVLVSRRLSKPLQLLARDTQRIAQGDFSYRVNIRRRDEIGNLAQAYNEMTSKLEQREADREHLQLIRRAVVLWAGVSGTLSMEKFCSGLTKVVLDSYDCDSVWLLLVKEQRLESRAFLSRQPEARAAIESALGQDINQVSFDTQSDINLFTQAFNSRQPIFLEEPSSAGQGIIPGLLSGKSGAVVALPLCLGEECRGVLGISRATPFSPEERDVMLVLALHGAIALENARLYEIAHRQSQEKSRLYELAGVMSSSLELREVLDRALDSVMSLVPSPETAWAVIARFDEQSSVFTYEASRGASDINMEDLRLRVDETARHTFVPLLEGKVIMIKDITLLPEERRFPHFATGVMNKTEMKSWLVIPLMVKGRLIGTLRISNKLPLLPSEEQMEALRNLASNIAIAMENARLYAEERQRVAELKSLEQIKTDFMLAISHELKTPLTSMKVSAGLLQEEVNAEQGTPIYRLLKGMVSSIERLNRLVSDLLEAARLESSAVELNWEFADIVPVVNEAAATLAPLMESKGQQFVMKVPLDGLWSRVDLQRLEQIVTNLLSNAHKFTPEGGQIQLIIREEGKNFILEVSDTGPGIPEEEQQRVFEPFYRVRGIPRHTGSGLGLNVARRLAELLGGSITISSQPGQGATFIVTIPKGAEK